jgi:hypothetical protein
MSINPFRALFEMASNAVVNGGLDGIRRLTEDPSVQAITVRNELPAALPAPPDADDEAEAPARRRGGKS